MCRRRVFSILVVSVLLPTLAAGAPPNSGNEVELPSGSEVIVTASGDVTADGRTDLLIGYRVGKIGEAVMLERLPSGAYRRWNLQGAWPGHYEPRFTLVDLTGDGRPEVVTQVPVAGAIEAIYVNRWAAGRGFEQLLTHQCGGTALWDANGDGLDDLFCFSRFYTVATTLVQRFRWDGDKFIAWHEVLWSYPSSSQIKRPATVPNLKGLTLSQAEAVLAKDGVTLGIIAAIDNGLPARIKTQAPPPGTVVQNEEQRVNLALAAADTSFASSPLPKASNVVLHPGPGRPDAVEDRRQVQLQDWENWLRTAVGTVQQVVYSTHPSGPLYLVWLKYPWAVSLGGRWEAVYGMGVGIHPPDQGLIYLVRSKEQDSQTRPKFAAALYIKTKQPIPAKQ